MAIKNNPDGTYQIDTPGYGHLLYRKLYNHPKSMHELAPAVERAKELRLVLPSLDEALALRCSANTLYGADKPQLTRTALWQWRIKRETYVMLENTHRPDLNTVMASAEQLQRGSGAIILREDEATGIIKSRGDTDSFTLIDVTNLPARIPLEDLTQHAFTRTALHTALEPYARQLAKEGHTHLQVNLPVSDIDSFYVLVSHLVLGKDNRLIFDKPVGFCQGVRRKEINYATALHA